MALTTCPWPSAALCLECQHPSTSAETCVPAQQNRHSRQRSECLPCCLSFQLENEHILGFSAQSQWLNKDFPTKQLTGEGEKQYELPVPYSPPPFHFKWISYRWHTWILRTMLKAKPAFPARAVLPTLKSGEGTSGQFTHAVVTATSASGAWLWNSPDLGGSLDFYV